MDRLVEIRADDVAITRHPRISLARALVAMATAGNPGTPAAANPSAPMPATALAATGSDAMQRLLTPPARLTVWQRWGITGGLAMMVAAPAVILAGEQLYPFLATCPTWFS